MVEPIDGHEQNGCPLRYFTPSEKRVKFDNPKAAMVTPIAKKYKLKANSNHFRYFAHRGERIRERRGWGETGSSLHVFRQVIASGNQLPGTHNDRMFLLKLSVAMLFLRRLVAICAISRFA